MKQIKTLDSVGKALMHDITQIIVNGNETKKHAVFRKNHVIREEDIDVLLSVGKDYIYAFEIPEGMVHENDAAKMLADMCKNDFLVAGDIAEGRIDISVEADGILKVNKERLFAVNMVENFMISTIHNNSRVKKGDKVAGMKIIPLMVSNEEMEYVKNLNSQEAMFRLLPYKPKKVGLVITGNEIYLGRKQDAFSPLIKEKLKEFGAELIATRISDDSVDMITGFMEELSNMGAEILLCTGGMSVDPDDRTPIAIREFCSEVISHGSPVLPGAMLMLGYKNEMPVLGVPGGALFAKHTFLDLLLPRMMADDKITKPDFANYGHGGYCTKCLVCNFPNCRFGK